MHESIIKTKRRVVMLKDLKLAVIVDGSERE